MGFKEASSLRGVGSFEARWEGHLVGAVWPECGVQAFPRPGGVQGTVEAA